MKYSKIGGQGVLEGVMMRSPKKSAIAVRMATKEIITKTWDNKKKTGKVYKIPVIRGTVNFIATLIMGVKTTTDSAVMYDNTLKEEYKPSKFELFVAKKTGKDPMNIMMAFAVVVSLVFAIALFFILPTVVTNWIKGSIQNTLLINFIDGAVRLLIFIGYIIAIAFMKDIKRVFMYHGAEHKVISCYEHEEPLTVENVRKHSRLHPRCGTSFLLLVMMLTILIYACFGWSSNVFLRLGIRILMLPVIAGLSYELLMLLGKKDNLLCKILRWPGMQLQRLTTRQPDDEMIEVAIIAFELALNEKSKEEMDVLIKRYSHSADAEEANAGKEEEQTRINEPA